MAVAFELEGQAFAALNGGPLFKLNEAISLQVVCATQEEVDHYWAERFLGDCGFWVMGRSELLCKMVYGIKSFCFVATHLRSDFQRDNLDLTPIFWRNHGIRLFHAQR